MRRHPKTRVVARAGKVHLRLGLGVMHTGCGRTSGTEAFKGSVPSPTFELRMMTDLSSVCRTCKTALDRIERLQTRGA
jgi:hypothetical protein